MAHRFSLWWQYLKLYGKSIHFVWRASKMLSVLLLASTPLQALVPTASLYCLNQVLEALEAKALSQAWPYLLAWALLFMLGNLLDPLTTFIQGQLTDRLTYYFNEQLMTKAQQLQSIAYYEDPDFYNEIQLLSDQASWRPVNLLIFGTSILSQFLMVISIFSLLASFHWLLTVLLLLSILPQAWMSYRIQKEAFEVLVSNSQDSRRLTYYTKALLDARAIKEVRLYNLYDFFLRKYRTQFRGILQKVQHSRLKRFGLSALYLLVTGGLAAYGFYFIASGIAKGTFGLGTLAVYTSAILYAVQGLNRLVTDSSMLYDTLLYMKKLFHFLALPEDSQPGQLPWSGDFEELRFDQVTFSYPGQAKPALDELSFTVSQGEKIAIVGENGAGKSTLVKCLLRLYPLSRGEITLDGQDIQSFDVLDYRKNFAAIFQDFAPFDLTLAENVQLADLDQPAGGELCREALWAAGFREDLPLEQMLGKRFSEGVELSGGQWQKVALARVFYSRARFLVLDEPTASLDPKIEREVLEKLLELGEDRTVLYVTHRLGTVRQADRVLLLKEGRVLGFAKHDTLLHHNAYYRELYAAQAEPYQ